MRHEVMFAGFGGQGVIKAAILLTIGAGLYEGREVAQTQSYGPEARGGACRSQVVLSEKAIDYIKPLCIDVLSVMSQPAMDMYGKDIDPDKTLVVYDSTLVTNLPPLVKKAHPIPATREAETKLGKALFANIIMLGGFCALTSMVSLDSLKKALKGNVPPQTLAKNQMALDLGYELAKGLAA
ncbi:2-oxoacid:acceptor oxidoreductase family protein [Dethiosulfatarculus sandiegensis]|uniref:2-oxoglutarate ferredoxin oxidoreductase subunit gamma n=1 Tax=Dethiosulfatarculus sandiegensis TaxID=1429043 RepID=A0A0D2GEA1_9BACT|nr:2-oxoacid:acceptor oxidoreductase family protein [Dethiosulfatarculus sandiegensis]KIX13322.1 2-oxoglutarate ferredoxin oxidoreductase subunit gamma [Dethiosulfatarculus sandiegensis]